MPLLKRKPFKRNPIPEGLRDDDEVFFCQQTKEVFKSFDEFFERVMLTNSVIWQCALTGRPELTYAEALASEKTARRLLRQFPIALRGPIILVASLTKRSALKELVDDVFNFVKDRYFKGEKLDVMNESGRGSRYCMIVDVLTPENYDATKSVEPAEIRYRVEAVDDGKEPKQWTVKGEALRRDKTLFTKEKTKLFLKQQVEGFNAMLKVKEESLQKCVIEKGLKMEEIFIGKMPDFEISKKLQLQLEKNSKKSSPTKGKKSNKQGDITKYLNNSGASSKQLTTEEKKKREENSKKFREEMEAKRKEKAELEAEKQKKVVEERARVLAKVQATVREYNQVRDDLELTDQRVIPKGKNISTLMDQKYFADFIKILEFLHSFPEVLSISDKFPYGINIETLERALIMKEVNGPLSDILQVLLGTVFSLQVEEENEIEVEYRINGDLPLKHSKTEQMKNAARVHNWAAQHYSTKINEMVMDSTTISELLRLHLLGSGASVSERTSKYRFASRGGYKSHDDPGLILATKYPHIIKFLSQYSVFQLSTKDILRVLGCLTDQIVTYSNLREVIEDRLEQSSSAKLHYKNLKADEGRRERKIIEEKKILQEELKTLIASFAEEPADKKEALIKKAETELELKFAKIDAQSVKDKAQHLRELKAQVSIYFNHQTFLGCDRAFRNYYIFESLPGLFVEHDITFSGKCSEQSIQNNPALAHCTKEQRYGIIKQMVTNEEAGGSDDKENKIEINGAELDKSPATGKKENYNDLQKDLFMCNCDPATCIVHSETPERNEWTYFNTAEEVDALIESLNVRGYREKVLKEQLEASHDLIVDYIKTCPTQKLTVEMDKDEKVDEMKKIVRRSNKKYENANLNCITGTDPNEIYDSALREILLDFENKLNMGCLGVLKVQDRLQWRKFVEDLEYCSLDDNLKWGNSRKVLNGTSNGHADEEDPHGDDLSEETASSVGDLEPAHTFDSGNCSDLETDDDEGAKLKTSQMEAVKLKVKNLAMALLQIEQGIDIKFIRAPFGPVKELKDKDSMVKAMHTCKKRILRWEESLMKSTSYAQVFLHYNILHDSILWSRSAQRVGCMICRRKNDPEQTLLCDECNKGWHMYCMKPKLTAIPQGDWFCPRCRPDDYKPTTRKRRQEFVQEVESEEEEELTADDSTVEDASESEAEVCMVCNYEGDMIQCSFCDMQCHAECAKPPVKKSKGKKKPLDWKCWKCTSVQQRSDRIKRRRMDKDEGDESEESEVEDEQPLLKVRKVEKTTGRRSKRALEESDESEDSDDFVPKKVENDKRSKRRASAKNSRRNSPETDDAPISGRRSSKKFVEESSTERRASKRSLDSFNTISLSTLVDEVIKHKHAWPFTKPVSANEVPDYFDVIKRPMDFGRIKSKLNLGDYRINEQAMKDMELVFYNCDLYNTADSDIYKAGAKLEKFVAKRAKELNLPYHPSDMTSSN